MKKLSARHVGAAYNASKKECVNNVPLSIEIDCLFSDPAGCEIITPIFDLIGCRFIKSLFSCSIKLARFTLV